MGNIVYEEPVVNCDQSIEVIANCENPQETTLSQYDIEKLIVTVRGVLTEGQTHCEQNLSFSDKRADHVEATIHSRYYESFQTDLKKHNEQYHEIHFLQLPHKNHDRFLIIDDDVYLLGASVKDMGIGLCAITKMQTTPETILELLK